jgi:pyruvyltransferase
MIPSFKKKYILVAWAGAEIDENKNFGDELAWYIVGKLSNRKIVKADFISKKWILVHFLKSILLFRFNKIYSYFLQFFEKNYLLSVGSILSFAKCNGGVVWGSGIIASNVNVIDFDFRAVRGPITRARLLELGYHVPKVYGDPALLLPLIYKNNSKKSFKLGIVPHIIHESFFKNLNDSVSFISLKGNNIHSVIDKICACDYIISTSLHGIIVAHAYGVPAIWLSIAEEKLLGDDIKFFDYFQSVNFFQKQPIVFSDSFLFSLGSNEFLKYFEEYNINDLDLIIKQRQLDLINSAPFEINNNLF